MSTLKQLRSSIERELADLDLRIQTDRNEIQEMLSLAESQGRNALTQREDQRADALFAAIRTTQAARARKAEALSQARAIEAEEAETDRRMGEVHETPAGLRNRQASRTATVSVTHNERLYHQGNDPRGNNFLRDVARAQVMQDPEAQTKLARHQQEERIERGGYQERAAGDLVTGTSGAGSGGIVVPQYLVDLTGQAAAAKRPLADAMTHHQLPSEGMTLTVPVITTATAVGNQTTQLTTTGVGATSMNVTDLTLSVYTAAGYQNVSRQAVDRSRVDEFVLQDLMVRYASNLDSNILNLATVGLAAKSLSTLGAFADTQPTGAKLYPKILAASSGVEAQLMGSNADLAVMHSRRFAWLSKEMTSTWPLINSQGIPTQASGVNYNKDYGAGFRGVLPNGLAIIVDNNVTTTATTNQDEIYVVPSSEAHLFEDANAPAYIRAEQPNATSLGILFVVFGYYAFTFDRGGSGSMQKVAGTGLTTPTF